MLNMTSAVENGKASVALEGRLDTSSFHQFKTDLWPLLERATDLTLNFENLDYISSAGLRVLLEAQKLLEASDGQITIKNANNSIVEVFELTGFDEFITLE